MVVAYAKGDIDGYFAGNAYLLRTASASKGVDRLPGRGTLPGLEHPQHGPDFIKAHPDTVRKVLRAMLKAQDFIEKHSDESLALVCRRLKVEPEIGKTLWKETVYRVELDRTLPELMERIGRWRWPKRAPRTSRSPISAAISTPRPLRKSGRASSSSSNDEEQRPAFWLAVATLLASLAVWEGLSRSGLYSPHLFPPPTRVSSALWAMFRSGELWADFKASAFRWTLESRSESSLGSRSAY